MRLRLYEKAGIAGLLLLGLLLCFIPPAGAASNVTPSGTPIFISGPNIDAINAYNQSLDLAEQGKYQDALALNEKALSIQPNFSLAWAQEAGLLVVLGRDNEAVTAADKAIAGNPNISEAWANRADALNNLGRYQEALQSANQSLALDPTLKAAQDSKKLAQAMLTQVNQATATPTNKAPVSLVTPLAGLAFAGLLLSVLGRKKQGPGL